jgi:phospho-N-acetylmuramoyl-pentapeptide-transferase
MIGPLELNALKIFILSFLSFLISFLIAPFLINFLYHYQLWKKKPRDKTIDGKEATVFLKIHKEKEVNTPRMGGLLIWTVPVFLAFLFSFLSHYDGFWISKLNFLSREQTWLLLAALVFASIIGLIDDILQVFGKGKYIGGGLDFKVRLFLMIIIGLIGGYWFYFKLGKDSIYLPILNTNLKLGIFYIPFFIIVTLSCWAGGVIDGIDGLAGGSFLSIFGAFMIIAFARMQYNVAAFCGTILGSLLAFLWYNLPPAKFYMGETGMMGLSVSLAIVSFLTDSVSVLPIIAGLLVLEVASILLQLFSKKFFKKKIFLCTPLHHHFEAIGWKPETVTMRFWILGIVFALLGTAIRLLK